MKISVEHYYDYVLNSESKVRIFVIAQNGHDFTVRIVSASGIFKNRADYAVNKVYSHWYVNDGLLHFYHEVDNTEAVIDEQDIYDKLENILCKE